MVISIVATFINFVVARHLLRAGKAYRSITLEADAKHIMTDVWTTGGVLLAIAGAGITGWRLLDPLVALVVAANIVWTGVGLLRRSALGLLDTALPAEDLRTIRTIVARHEEQEDIRMHALRTREAGARRFVSFHILVPGWWSVHEGHRLLEEMEAELRDALPGVTVFTHLEALDDPASYADTTLDRRSATAPVRSRPPGDPAA